MARRNKNEESLFTPKQKLQIRFWLFVAELIVGAVFLYIFYVQGMKMITHTGTNSEAQQAIMKNCSKQAEGSGLKNNEYTKYWHQCVAEGQAKLKSAKQ